MGFTAKHELGIYLIVATFFEIYFGN